MNKSQQAMNAVCKTYQDLGYVRGQTDCVQFVLDYMEALGLNAPTIRYGREERLSAKTVMRYLGKPLPQGAHGDVVLCEQFLGLNPKTGHYITMSKAEGELVMATLPPEKKLLQWQVAEET